jgi:Uma2 family endonuclease
LGPPDHVTLWSSSLSAAGIDVTPHCYADGMSITRDVKALMTWDEFVGLPFETRNTDLVDGKMIVNPPNAQHERVIRKLLLALERWQDQSASRLGEATTQQLVKVVNDRGYQPDLSWFPIAQCAGPSEPAAFTGLPAVVVEVLSPSTRRFDLVRKANDYRTLGIPEYWLIDPDARSVLVLSSGADTSVVYGPESEHDGRLLVSEMLPGFSTNVADLFVS